MKIYTVMHGHTELNKKKIINTPQEGIEQAKLASLFVA